MKAHPTTSKTERRDRHESKFVPYTMRLSDDRIVFVEVPKRMTVRDRSGELAFTLEGVRLLDRVQALAMEPSASPSPAYLATLRERWD